MVRRSGNERVDDGGPASRRVDDDRIQVELDHLDGSGAEEAIRIPLQEYNKTNGASGKIESKLVETLIRDADVTKLEMDESEEDTSSAPNERHRSRSRFQKETT